jgi:hypothetical protein
VLEGGDDSAATTDEPGEPSGEAGGESGGEPGSEPGDELAAARAKRPVEVAVPF